MKKRVFAVLLALVLAALLVPMTASAAGHVCVLMNGAQEIGNYATVQGAVNAATNGQTVKLIADVEENVETSGKTITIDLNDHVLKGAGGDSVIRSVNGNYTLTVTDSAEVKTKKYFTVDSTGLWVLTDQVTENYVTGGVITGGTGFQFSGNKMGGGIRVVNTKLSVSGGNIVGNTATYGGGIYASMNATVDISGATVIGNVAKNGGGINEVASKLTIRETVIAYNTAEKAAGGLYICGRTVVLGDGTVVTNNRALQMLDGRKTGGIFYESDRQTDTMKLSGKVIICNNTCIVNDVTTAGDLCFLTRKESTNIGNAVADISELTAGSAVGVSAWKNIDHDDMTDVFTTETGTATNEAYFFSNVDGKQVYLADDNKLHIGTPVAQIGDYKYESVQSAINASTSGQTVKLIADVKENLVVSGKTVTIDLNDHVLKGTGGNSVIYAENGAKLTISDNAAVKTKKYFTVDGTGLWTLTDQTTENYVTGGVITGGTGYEQYNNTYGGGVGAYHGNSELTVTGGNIVGNTATYGGGIGWLAYQVTMTGGNIVGNTATYGGGLFTVKVTTTVSNVTIVHNTATNLGGGVYVESESVTLGDGTVVTDNVCTGTTPSAGVFAHFSKNNGWPMKVAFSGKVVIRNNVQKNGTTETAADFCPNSKENAVLENDVSGLTAGSDIGVTVLKDKAVDKGVFTTATGTATNEAYFFSNVDGKQVYLADDNKLYIGTPVAQIGDYKYESVQSAINASASGQTVKLIADVKESEVVIAGNKDLTLDLNGYSLTITQTGIDVAGKLTIKDGSDAKTGKAIGKDDNILMYIETTGEVTVDGGKLVSTSVLIITEGKLTVNGGELKGGILSMDASVALKGGAVDGELEGDGFEISGGVYTYREYWEYLADGYAPVTNEDEATKDYRYGVAPYHIIYNIVTEHGTADVTLYAAPGTAVIVDTYPDTGYVLDKVLVYKADDPSQVVAVVGTHFIMPDYDVRVKASFTEAVPVTKTIQIEYDKNGKEISKIETCFDSCGRINERKVYGKIAGEWQLRRCEQVTYEDGLKVSEENFSCDDGILILTETTKYEYAEGLNTAVIRTEYVDGEQSHVYRTEYIYTGGEHTISAENHYLDGTLTEKIIFYANETTETEILHDEKFKEIRSTQTEYDIFGRRIRVTITEAQAQSKTTILYYYNASGNGWLIVSGKYDVDTQELISYEKKAVYTYDSYGFPIAVENYMWNKGAWELQTKTEITWVDGAVSTQSNYRMKKGQPTLVSTETNTYYDDGVEKTQCFDVPGAEGLFRMAETVCLRETMPAMVCENGYIQTSSDNICVGDTVTVDTVPAEGYELDELRVYKSGDENTIVTVTDGQFVMPTYPVTIEATFKKTAETLFAEYKEEEKGKLDDLGEDEADVIKNAKEALDALTYDKTKTLDENKAAVDGITSDVPMNLNKARFEAYKEEKKPELDDLGQDYGNVITDAKDALDALTYDETKTLDENKAIADGVVTQTGEDWESKRKSYAPQMTEGADQTIDVGTQNSAVFRSEAPYGEFVRVKIDGTELTSGFTASEGSTVITLEEALDSLDNGTHTICIVSQYGTAEANFTVVGRQAPQNGDRDMTLWTVAMLMAAAVIAISVKKKIRA